MFGIGTGELLLLALIALLVLGPERMPKLARDIGRTVGELRRTSDELRSEFLNADRSLDLEKALDVAARRMAPEPGASAEPAATQGDAPPAAAAPAALPEAAAPSAPAEPAETAFDREVRIARERIDARPADEEP